MHTYGIEGKIDKPKINRPLPYLPLDNLDFIIANAGYSMALFLQTLKETAARPVEAPRILWEDIGFFAKQNLDQLSSEKLQHPKHFRHSKTHR